MINPENLNCAYMEEQGFSLGVIPAPRPDLKILREDETWVAYDEAGLEMARNDNYWLLRRLYIEYGQCLNMDRLPASGDVWRHHKGNEYTIDKLTNQFSDYLEFQTQVVYFGANGKVWSKGLGDFIEKMTFVRPAESAACEPIQDLHIHSLGIKGMVAGEVYPGKDLEDAAQADITMHMHANHGGGSDHFWHAMIHVNAPTPEKAAELRDIVMKGLHMASNPFTDLSLASISPEDAEALAKAFDSSLPGTIMAMEPILRDSLEFEGLLCQYHSEVWEAAENEDSLLSYDEAGLKTAKKLIAMFRGEAEYTHHLDRPAPRDRNGEPFAMDQWWLQELAKVSLGQTISADLVRACAVARNLARAVLPEKEGDRLYYPVTAPISAEGTTLLEKGEVVLPACDPRFADFDKARELPPLIVKLHEGGQQIAQQAFDTQEATHAALATRPKPPCTECKGSGGSWLAGAPAHPDNWTECDVCKGKGTL